MLVLAEVKLDREFSSTEVNECDSAENIAAPHREPTSTNKEKSAWLHIPQQALQGGANMNISYSKATRILTILLALSFGLSLLSVVSPVAAATSALNFRTDMRKLWEDHVTWTRLYIVSAAADLPDKD